MNIHEIIQRCNGAIPRECSYMGHEPYGAYGIPSDRTNVRRILYCVTQTPEVLRFFKQNNYDLLICHHPFSTYKVPTLIYHTALDCCEGGLNDLWAEAIGLKSGRKHFDQELGWFGELMEPIKLSELVKKVKNFSGGVDGQVYGPQNELIKSVVICSGLGGLVSQQALLTGADCYILGEAIGPASKMGFKAVIETGHTNSEWIGVLFFKKLFKKEIESGELVIDGAPLDIDVFGREYYSGKYEQNYIIKQGH